MAKRQTKADAILNDARERLAKAQSKMSEAQEAARIAAAVYGSELTSFYALERSLAPKPRKKPASAQKDLLAEKAGAK